MTTSSNNLEMIHDEISPHPNTSEPSMAIPNKTTQIYQLNDDCLLNILNYLDFSDQFNLARSCEQFQNAFVLCVRSEYEEFYPGCQEFKNLATNEQREFLALVGRHILVMRIELDHADDTIYELTGEFCPNLSTVNLTYYSPMFNINKLVDNLQMITDLVLCAVEINCNHIGDSDILVLKKLTHLKKLTLFDYANMTGKHLKQLKTLQHLILGHCYYLIPNHIIEMLKALVDLHTLKLVGCKTITLDVCHTMVQYSKKLQYLSIRLLKGFEIIARLPSLKRLEVKFDAPQDIVHMLKELVEKTMQLEYLKIRSSKYVRAPNIALMLGSLKELKVLECDILLNNINDDWFYHLSKLENLQDISLACYEMTIDGGFLQILANCKRLSCVKIYCRRYPSVPFDSSFHKAIAQLRSNREERVLPVLFFLQGLSVNKMDAEYTKAVKDGIVRLHK